MRLSFFIATVAALSATNHVCQCSEGELRNFLKTTYEKNASAICDEENNAHWNLEVDINNKTKSDHAVKTTLKRAQIEKEFWLKYFKDLDPNDYVGDEELRRQVKQLRKLGDAALSPEKLAKLTEAMNAMANIYSTAKICPYSRQNCDLKTEGLRLTPDLEEVMSKSIDYDELVYVWKAWRDASGAKMRSLFETSMELSNEAAKLNHFTDKSEEWREEYETPNLEAKMEDLWHQVEPLYTELHTYVANKLKTRFGDQLDISDSLIPAHIFGNMWAQDWIGLSSLVKPYPNASDVDVNGALRARGFTVRKMFETADEFYQSLGLLPNDVCYDESRGAMIERPTDGRDVVCHASAWDFCNGRDFRVKMCTVVNFEDFVVIHHEMGHIQYYQQYKDQPYVFRAGANPGFHEAIGDTIALSVATPKHLMKIHLLDSYDESEQSDLNALMDVALAKIAFLPFGLLIDKWRWDVFSGNVSPNEWNSHWWRYRQMYQKIKPPVSRSDEHDFDPGAKHHVAAYSQYIQYFIAHILQFQLYKSLCISAGQYDPNGGEEPLHKCDFYQSKAAGDKLKAGLSLGFSQHWSKVLEVMTGEEDLNADAILEYFKPLYDFLKEENDKLNK